MGILYIKVGGSFVAVPTLLAPNAVTAGAVIADNAAVRGGGGARDVQGSSVDIADDGVVSIPGIGDGGFANYDLCVGDVTTPSYGMIQMGASAIGRTSFKAGAIDLDGAVLCRNIDGPVTSEIEFIWTESTGGTARFALPKSAVGNATYNSRSMLCAGPAPANTDFVKVSYWQGQGIFDNLVCDTSGLGADFGVQHDLEVENNIFCDTLVESTLDAGITVESVLLKDGIVDAVKVVTPEVESSGNLSLKAAAGDVTVEAVGAGNWIRLQSKGNIFVDLGDNAGADKVSIRDSGLIVRATIDSDGKAAFTQVALADNQKIILGTSGDVEVYYDAANFVIDPDVRGSGFVDIRGDLEVDKIGIGGTSPASAGGVYFNGDSNDLSVVLGLTLESLDSGASSSKIMDFTLKDSATGFAGFQFGIHVETYENRSSVSGSNVGTTAMKNKLQFEPSITLAAGKTYTIRGLHLDCLPVTNVDRNGSTVNYFPIDIEDAPTGFIGAGTTNYYSGRVKGDWWIALDDIGLLLGADEDAKISYDGTDLVIESAVVGGGTVDFSDQTHTAIEEEALSGYVTMKVAGVSRKFAIVS